MPAPPPESLPAIVSAVRMLVTFRPYDALSRRLCFWDSATRPARGRSGRLVAGRARGRAGAVAFAVGLTGGVVAGSASRCPGSPVPFTLQPVAVLLAGVVLGARLGALSQVLYLFGSASPARRCSRWSPVLLPGAARLLGPTGGFLMAFPLAAFARRPAARPRLDPHRHAGRRWRDGGRPGRSFTPAASRGLALFCRGPARPGLRFAPYAAADVVKVALVAPGRAGRACGRSGRPAACGAAAVAAAARPKIRKY